jgi:hypothetical protein
VAGKVVNFTTHFRRPSARTRYAKSFDKNNSNRLKLQSKQSQDLKLIGTSIKFISDTFKEGFSRSKTRERQKLFNKRQIVNKSKFCQSCIDLSQLGLHRLTI